MKSFNINMKQLILALIICFLAIEPLGLNWVFAEPGTVSGNRTEQSDIKLSKLSIEQLMGIKVKLVSKREQTLSNSPSAVYVITHEEIRCSGATSIPEALRMVPGLHVAKKDSNKWAITARGFNDIYANKLLVMIDGRSVYNTLFAGVYWDVQDTLLEDIDRIEVIRGPGSTVWGSNAVNGVINVITKKSEDTRGIFVKAGGGDEERGFGSIRYGGSWWKYTGSMEAYILGQF